MDITELVKDEVSWLARQEGKTLNKMMRVYQDSFIELEGKLKQIEGKAKPDGKTSYTERQIRATKTQIGAVLEEMRTKHSEQLGSQVRRVFNQQISRDKNAWAKLEQTFGDPAVAKQFADFKPVVPQRTIKALVNAQDFAIKGFNTRLQQQIRLSIAQGMSQGEGVKDLLRRVQPFKDSAKNKNHLHLIVRMESARASNAAKLELIKEQQKEFPDREFWLMVKDRVDRSKDTRNHWLSWALSGTVRNVTKGEYYEVYTAALNATKADYTAITHRKASLNGVLMKSFARGLRTKSIPAHFWDRAVEVPWSPDWKGSAFGEAKHPQGSTKPVKLKPNPSEYQAPASVSPPASAARPPIASDGLADIQNPEEQAPPVEQKPIPTHLIDHQIRYQDLNQHQRDVLTFNHHEMAKPFEQRHEVVMTWDDEGKRQFAGTGPYDPVIKGFNVRIPESVQGNFLSHSHPSGTSFSIEDLFEASIKNMPSLDAQGEIGKQNLLYFLERPTAGWPIFDEAKKSQTRDDYVIVLGAMKDSLKQAALNPNSDIEPEHVNIWARHLTMVEISKRFGLKYLMYEILEVPHAGF